jgi:thioredoxin-like negative regulator of GroEL
VAGTDNLKPFKPGFDPRRNIDGRPKAPDIGVALAKVLSEEKDGKTALDAILMALRSKAAKGDVRAAELLMDRAFGKSKNHTDITSNGNTIAVAPIKWADE